MIGADLRRVYHVARVDFLERIRSRKLVVFLAAVAYVGYLVNVGGVNLAYTAFVDGEAVQFVGRPTAALIGLKTALIGGAVVVFGAFYLMRTGIARDRRHGHGTLVASSETSDAVYLLGKLTSNVALGGVVVATLAVAAVVNHAVHGVGGTDVLALVTPLLVLTLPVCVLVGSVALVFETVPWFDGTLGTVVHLIAGSFALTALAGVGDAPPAAVPLGTRAADLLGYLPVYEMTLSALTAEVSSYGGGLPSVGTLQGRRTFTYRGSPWPLWVFPQRLGIVAAGVAVALATTLSFDRFRGTSGVDEEAVRRLLSVTGLAERVGDRLGLGSGAPASDPDPTPVEAVETTPVRSRENGGFLRLVRAEFRLAVRDHRWWWYAGVAATLVVPLVLLANGAGVPDSVRGIFLALAFAWPMPVWSELGARAYRAGTTDLLFSSEYAVRQVVAEWLAGVGVGVLVGAGTALLAAASGETTLLVGLAAGAVFPPSLAVALGVWTHSSRLFEVAYLLVWYLGPINGARPANFLATTTETSVVVPLAFAAVSGLLVGAALLRRVRETT